MSLNFSNARDLSRRVETKVRSSKMGHKEKQPAKPTVLSAPQMRAYQKLLAIYHKKPKSLDPLHECTQLIKRKQPKDVLDLLEVLPPAWADHVIASVYAILMSKKRRKKLGVYFTPPHLVSHLVTRLKSYGLDPIEHKIRDSAAGGAAFLVPLARIKVTAWRERGVSDTKIVEHLKSHLIGRDIEEDLAYIANALLRRMLIHEFSISADLANKIKIVRTGDSLDSKSATKDAVNHEIGNPPFLRLKGNDKRAKRNIIREISSGRLNLYAIFVRRALEEVPSGGLVGYVVPASFLGGPEFALFRRRILQLADVLSIDLIEKRNGVFLGAIQDACFLILRKREITNFKPALPKASSGILFHNGEFSLRGEAEIQPDGTPWRLPCPVQISASTLKDWGYKATTGYLVANRQTERLHKRYAKGRFPMIWAKSIKDNGHFDFARGAAFKGLGWADAPADASYIVRLPCVAVQRTSARGQKRRLYAAPISKAFIGKYTGIIGENHVILIVPINKSPASPDSLAKELNRPRVSAELDSVCGSASISVRLLESIRLSKPPSSKKIKKRTNYIRD